MKYFLYIFFNVPFSSILDISRSYIRFYIPALSGIIPILLHAKAREWRDVEQTGQNEDGQSTKLPDAIVPRDNRHARVSLESIGAAR